jgi:hypothetical protein
MQRRIFRLQVCMNVLHVNDVTHARRKVCRFGLAALRLASVQAAMPIRTMAGFQAPAGSAMKRLAGM